MISLMQPCKLMTWYAHSKFFVHKGTAIKKLPKNAEFKVFTAMTMKGTVFWILT
jgi:hypothetical protein